MRAVCDAILASWSEKADAGTGTPQYVEWEPENETHTSLLISPLTIYIRYRAVYLYTGRYLQATTIHEEVRHS